MKQLTFSLARAILSLLIAASIAGQATAQTETHTIIGVGDIMLGTDFPSKAYLPQGSKPCAQLDDVRALLQDADVTFGNLEGAFSDNAKVTKRCNDPSVCYAFRTPTRYFQCIVDAGFDAFSLANNHSGDLGAPGRKHTLALINEAKLHHAGLLSHPTTTFVRNGVKYGLAAFAPNNGTCNINDYPLVKRLIRELASQCDIVIVSFHGGAEGSRYQHVTKKRERFYGENRGNVYEFARVAIDAGADLILGHGPHVSRAVDIYKGRFIAYSLGNFATYSRMNLRGVNGLAPLLKVWVDKEGRLQKAHITSIKQIKGKGTFKDSQHTAYQRIKTLTQQDLPEAELRFEAEGWIYPKN